MGGRKDARGLRCGTGVLLRGQDDLDAVYGFTLGEPNTLPLSVSPAVVGMRAGGIRRILVPPRYGWGANGTPLSRSLHASIA